MGSQSSFVSCSSETSLNMILKDLFLLSLGSTLSLVTTSQPTPEGRDPEITKFHVASKIQLCYASTEVLSHMNNPSSEVQEVTFEIRLPEKAFIHAFSMMVNGTEHVAKVEAKEEARETYDSAKEVGIGAGLVTRDTEDTNLFSVATNVPGNQEVVFKLQYEELLEREKGWYSHLVNLGQDKVIPDLKVEAFIKETLPLKAVEVPELLQSNELDGSTRDMRVELEQIGDQTNWEDGLSHIVYHPTGEQQQAAQREGKSGQFRVNYQVQMEPEGEIQVIDGYFVHFTEDDPKLEALPKYTVFVLDVSGSMQGEKITQLQDAMFTILDDMTEDDYFSIITFSYDVQVWTSPEIIPMDDSLDPSSQYIMQATKNNRDVAIAFTNGLVANGGTNIDSAMLRGLWLAKQNLERVRAIPKNENTQAMVVFLTDGVPTSGVTSKPMIKSNIVEANELKMPLHCLAFGRDADFKLMKEISEEADSLAKMIYEGADAAIQLENFYAQISDPVVSKLKFEYVGVNETDADVVNEEINVVLRGSSYAHVGRLNDGAETLQIKLLGETKSGPLVKESKIWCEVGGTLPPCAGCISPSQRTPERSDAQNFMQRLHAYAHITKLLKRGNKAEREGLDDDDSRALQLALANNFVTSLTSLVVTTAQNDTTLASVGDELVQNTPFRRNYVFSGLQSYSGTPRFTVGLASGPPAGNSYPMVLNSPISSGGNWRQQYRDRQRQASVKSRGRGRLSGRGGARFSNRAGAGIPVTNNLGGGVVDYYESAYYAPSTTTTAPECQGNLTMWTRTYLRGESLQTNDDITYLSAHGFNNKLVSLEVSSGCCWLIFSEPNFGGETKLFPEGKYQSVSSVGNLFRAASSVRKTTC